MTHIKLVDPAELVRKTAEELKNQKLVQPPVWSKLVKTGQHKARLPDDPDWWYQRSAAVLRSVNNLGPVGTQKLRTKYGGIKRRGHQPKHFYKASGSVLRKILQQLEESKLIKKVEKGIHKGRIMTPKGLSLIDKIAVQISKQASKEKKSE